MNLWNTQLSSEHVDNRRSTVDIVRTSVPARLDRLPWSPFHSRLVVGLGVVWALDGLEATVASSIADVWTRSDTLNLSSVQVGFVATTYLIGQIVGALYFGWRGDKLGRRALFFSTLAIYLAGSALTALVLNGETPWLALLYTSRFIAGVGIGGEYVAINSAIDEMIPARCRGRVDIAINGTYWLGALIGSFSTYMLLNLLPASPAWRIGFLLGPAVAIFAWMLRRTIPESPRWQALNGHQDEAYESMLAIEEKVRQSGRYLSPLSKNSDIELYLNVKRGYWQLIKVLIQKYPQRSLLSLSLMMTQSFLYNSVFFTYTLVLGKVYHVDGADTPLYLVAFALGNLAGPLLLGRLFDVVGRKVMLAGTYTMSGILLLFTAYLYGIGAFGPISHTIAWSVIFFFASSGASAAYLTISEIFPLEVRAKAVAIFFVAAQALGLVGPAIFGALIGDGRDTSGLALAYGVAAVVMILGGVTAWIWGVKAEMRSLEDIAAPLSDVRRLATRRGDAGG